MTSKAESLLPPSFAEHLPPAPPPLPPPSSPPSLHSLKRRIREWELSFQSALHRPPTKADVSSSPDVFAAYRQYEHLKRTSSSSPLPPVPPPPRAPITPRPAGTLTRQASLIRERPSSRTALRPRKHGGAEFGYLPLCRAETEGAAGDGQVANAALHRIAATLSAPSSAGSPSSSLQSLLEDELERVKAAPLAGSTDASVSVEPSLHLRIAGSSLLAMKKTASDPLPPPPPPPPATHPYVPHTLVTATPSAFHKRVALAQPSPPSSSSTSVTASSSSLEHEDDEDDVPLQQRIDAARATKLRAVKEATAASPQRMDEQSPAPKPRSRAAIKRSAAGGVEEQGSSSKRRKKESGTGEVSRNFVRMNLRRKTKSYARGVPSGRSLRRAKQRGKRGWKSKAQWKKDTKDKDQQIEEALYAEIIDHSTARSLPSKRTASADGYDTDDDLQALRALDSAQAAHRESLTVRDPAALSSADLQSLLQRHFRFPSFRPFQLESIQHILSSPTSSSLLILPTAAGKSLCYLLPALVLRFTLVVSPLLSLMADQCDHLPPSLPGACWTSSSTLVEVQRYMSEVRSGGLKLLYVSPEKALSPSFTRFLASLPFKPSLLVIDEAHCILQWSHNFRPAFLHLRSVLERCERVLALTATATKENEAKMRQLLSASSDCVVIRRAGRREELLVRMKRVQESEKEQQVLAWLKEWRAKEKQRGYHGRAAIVYVQFREQADQLAAFLTSHSFRASAYHAGLPSHTRTRLQKAFLSSSVQSPVICATIAFGLGIDKADVGLVLHTHVPGCMEMYAQEMGRAGRDGRESDVWACWSGEDEVRARSWIWRDGVEQGRVRLLLRKLEEGGLRSQGRRRKSSQQRSQHRYVPLHVKALEEELNMSAEVALTLLSHVQLSSAEPPLQLCSSQHDTAQVSFTRSYEELERLSVHSPLLQHLMAEHLAPSAAVRADLSLCDVSNALDCGLVDVQAELLRLKAMGECSVQWSDDSLIVRLPSSPHSRSADDAELLQARERLVELVLTKQREHEKRRQLAVELIITAMHAVADRKADPHDLLHEYFERGGDGAHEALLRGLQAKRGVATKSGEGREEDAMGELEVEEGREDQGWAQVEASVRSFLDSEEAKAAGVAGMTSKSISLVLHALHTLSSPQSVWGKSRWWGKWKQRNFDTLEKCVEKLLLQWRMQQHESSNGH